MWLPWPDAYDAITSRRSYKDASPHHDGVALVQERSGTQFDPAVVDALLACESQLSRLAAELADDADEPTGRGAAVAAARMRRRAEQDSAA